MIENSPANLKSASFPDDWRVDSGDVAMSYRLFLGREAEDLSVLRERSGQRATEMLNGFVNSEEFITWSARVMQTSDDIASAFMQPAARAIVDWSARFFALDVHQLEHRSRGKTLLELVAAVLATPLLKHVIAGAQGEIAAAQLGAGLREAAIRRAEALGAAQSSSADIHHLYHVVLGRAPETPAAGLGRDIPLYAAATEFFASDEFAIQVIPAAVTGHLGNGQPLQAPVRQWLETGFGIQLDRRANRQNAIVALLKHEHIIDRLRKIKLLWSASAVADALSSEREEGEEQDRLEFAALLRSSGLFDPEWYAERYVDARQAEDPLAHFLDCGAYERLDPGPDFDTAYYLRHNSDAESSRLPPVEHYLRIGQARGAAASGPSSYAQWIERFDDLTEADRERIASDASHRPLPPVMCLHVGRSHDHARGVQHPATQDRQLGVYMLTREVDDGGAWPTERVLDDVADDTIVLIMAKPCTLRPHASFVFANALMRSAFEVVYSDHDHLVAGERRERPVFKPALSPDFMRQVPYAGPLVAVRLRPHNRSAIERAVSRSAAGDGVVALAELLLAEKPEVVGHVPMLLYSVPGGPYDEPVPAPFSFEPVPAHALRPVIAPTRLPNVCLLIPTRDHRDLLSACIDSIFAETRYPADRFEIVVIDNDTRDPDSLAYLAALSERQRCRVVASPGVFNFATICNEGAAATAAEVLVFLNNDMTVHNPDWLMTLVANAIRPDIGVVGGQLLYPDNTVQHGGVIVGVGGFGAHRLRGVPAQTAARFDVSREMTTVTGACIALRRSVFEEVGGFDPVLSVAFNDVALCMRVVQAGYRNLYVGQALLYHHESKSRGLDDTPEKVERNLREAIYTRQRFRRFFQEDRYYNPNLSLQETGALAIPPRVVRPWRRASAGHILILHDADVVESVTAAVAAQARAFLEIGWTVTVGQNRAPVAGQEGQWRTLTVAGAAEAAQFAMAHSVDCVMVHSRPFFAVAQYLGPRPLFYIHDHGAHSTSLATRATAREDDWTKRFHAPLAERVFVVSRAVADQQYRRDAIVVPSGNDHFTIWTERWNVRRAELRQQYNFERSFVVFSCPPRLDATPAMFADFETIAAEFRYAVPQFAQQVKFIWLEPQAREAAEVTFKGNVEIVSGFGDGALDGMFAASDLYISLQGDDGDDTALARAEAMGLEVIARDRPGLRATAVRTAASVPSFCEAIERAAHLWLEAETPRQGQVTSWSEALASQIKLIVSDSAAAASARWL